MHVRLRNAVTGIAVALVVACSSADAPIANVPAPTDLVATPVSPTVVKLTWKAPGGSVNGYEVQRREDLRGDFATIEASVPASGDALTYFDTNVDPDRFYGYRVRALTNLGQKSPLSNVAGLRTPHAPGVVVRTITSSPNAASVDPDGYSAVIKGSIDTTIALAPSGERIVSPLKAGAYTVTLHGLAANCAPANLADTMKTATVTDQGANTLIPVNFAVSCRDPQRASIVVVTGASGNTIDSAVTITVTGIISAANVPDSEKLYFARQPLKATDGATLRFDNLRPGDYEVALSDVDSICTVSGNKKRSLSPKALEIDTVRYAIACHRAAPPVDTAGKPFVLRNTWSSTTARVGDKVSLLSELDLTAITTQQAVSVATEIAFDRSVVRFDSARKTGTFDLVQVNPNIPGLLPIAAANSTGEGVSGDAPIVRLWFTVVGAVGDAVTTSTNVKEVLAPTTLDDITSKVHPSDATLTVITGSAGPPPNQAPNAVLNAPSSGTTGTPVQFSGASSSDPDGHITSYDWDFGDGWGGSGASASHTYTVAGTYTAMLVVTDDKGATGVALKAITITAAGPTGSIAGAVTSSLGGGLAGVTVAVQGGGSVVTGATGSYSIANVAVGSRSVSLNGLPGNCTTPAAQTVNVTAGATATANFVVTCTPTGPFTYPFTAAWGPITSTGPTGRQVTLSFVIDMGAAPGRPDIAGSDADPLEGISFSVGFPGDKLAYQSRTLLSPDELDIGTVGVSGAGSAGAQANVAIASSSGTTKTGAVQLIRLTFNIVAGVSGSITPVLNVTEALATTNLTNVTSTVSVQPAPTVTIP